MVRVRPSVPTALTPWQCRGHGVAIPGANQRRARRRHRRTRDAAVRFRHLLPTKTASSQTNGKWASPFHRPFPKADDPVFAHFDAQSNAAWRDVTIRYLEWLGAVVRDTSTTGVSPRTQVLLRAPRNDGSTHRPRSPSWGTVEQRYLRFVHQMALGCDIATQQMSVGAPPSSRLFSPYV